MKRPEKYYVLRKVVPAISLIAAIRKEKEYPVEEGCLFKVDKLDDAIGFDFDPPEDEEEYEE